jgi:hypothetical protein
MRTGNNRLDFSKGPSETAAYEAPGDRRTTAREICREICNRIRTP